MAYTHRKAEFLEKAYDIYLGKIARSREQLKKVKVDVKEINGKWLNELLAEGEKLPEWMPPGPWDGRLKPEYDPVGSLFSESKERENLPEKVILPQSSQVVKKDVVKAPSKARITETVAAERTFWFSSDISSKVADNQDYIKYRRIAAKTIKKWGAAKGLNNVLIGEGPNLRTIPFEDLESSINYIEIQYDKIIFKFQFNGKYESAQFTSDPDFVNFGEGRLSRLFYHLSTIWLPELEKEFSTTCGELKRFGEGEPYINVTFEDIKSDGHGSSIAYVSANYSAILNARMHFDLLDYDDLDLNHTVMKREDVKIDQTYFYDQVAKHEFHHFWSHDGFIFNIEKNLKPEFYKPFIEGFAEFWTSGQDDGILFSGERMISFGLPKQQVMQHLHIIKSSVEDLFLYGKDYNYEAGFIAIVFLAKRMFDNNNYILDFYKRLNQKPLMTQSEIVSVLKSFVPAYNQFEDYAMDFWLNWDEVIYSVLVDASNNNEQISVKSSFLGGPGETSKMEDILADYPQVNRLPMWGQNIFDENSGFLDVVEDRISVGTWNFFTNETNQIVYICEDGPDSSVANFEGLLKLKNVIEAYCIVITDSFSGNVTSTGIDVYDDFTFTEFSKKIIDGKTLYTIGVNWEESLTRFNHLARVLDMIPATVNKYEDPPNELVADNLLVTQTLS